MFRNILIIGLIIFINNSNTAQTTSDLQKIDSVLNILDEKKQDTNTVNHYHILSWEYHFTNDKKALKYGEKGYDLAKKLGWKKGILKMLHNLAQIHYVRDEYQESVKCNKEAIKIAKELNLPVALGDSYNNLGLNYDALSKFSDALKSYFSALKYYRITKNNAGETKTLGNIGNIYISLSDFEKAKDYHFKSMDLAVKQKDSSAIINAYVNLGLVDHRLGKNDSAIVKYLKALELSKKTNYMRGYYSICNNLGAAYKEIGDLKKAEEYIMIPYEYYKANHLDYQLALAAGNLGLTAMDNGNYPKAEKFLLETKEFAKRTQATEVEKDAVYFLYTLYKEWKKYNEALIQLEEYHILLDTLNNLDEQKKIAEQEAQMKVQNKQIADSLQQIQDTKEAQLQHDREMSEQKWFTYAGIGIACVAIVFLGLVYRNFRQKKRANLLLEEKNILIQKQKKDVEEQKLIVEEKQKEITDSINYAKRIQYSLLAHEDLLKQNLDDYFVLFKPKDIVSGDFYWATKKGNYFYMAVCDCTGHGVPGAFMSLLSISFLNEAINEKNISEPHEVLNFVRERLIQNMEGGKDGMDAILVRFKVQGSEFKADYAAAHNRPLLMSGNELKELPADKMPVGVGEKNDSFALHAIEVKKGDILYLYTDGYADQFGGEKARPDGSFGRGKKFKYANLNKLLLENSHLELSALNLKLETVFNEWKDDLEQVDDVCVIGVKI
jgi:serine phosphatase RsbU (regulator of sigma subunit)/Flp pilus assembly protein TadD